MTPFSGVHFPVFMLTIRQFFGGKSVWVVGALSFLPVRSSADLLDRSE